MLQVLSSGRCVFLTPLGLLKSILPRREESGPCRGSTGSDARRLHGRRLVGDSIATVVAFLPSRDAADESPTFALPWMGSRVRLPPETLASRLSPIPANKRKPAVTTNPLARPSTAQSLPQSHAKITINGASYSKPRRLYLYKYENSSVFVQNESNGLPEITYYGFNSCRRPCTALETTTRNKSSGPLYRHFMRSGSKSLS